MKKLTTPLLVFLMLSAILFSGYRLRKPEMTPIYVINPDTLMLNYRGTLEVQEIITNYQVQLRALIDSVESYQSLKGDSIEKLSNDPFFLHLQKDLEAHREKISHEATYYAVWLSDQINNGVTDYASENKIDYIFSSGSNSSIQYVSPKYDISSQVLTFLNERYTNEEH